MANKERKEKRSVRMNPVRKDSEALVLALQNVDRKARENADVVKEALKVPDDFLNHPYSREACR